MDMTNLLLDALGKLCVWAVAPYHSGIQKRHIEDVAITPLRWRLHYSRNLFSYRSGTTIFPTFKGVFDCVPEHCYEEKESFHVGLIILHEVEGQMFRAHRLTGYGELYRALWTAGKTTGCQCRRNLLPPTFELPAGCGALMVRCDDDFESCEEKLTLCLIGGDSIARW